MRSTIWSRSKLTNMFAAAMAFASVTAFANCTIISGDCDYTGSHGRPCRNNEDCEDYGTTCDFTVRRCFDPGSSRDAGYPEGSVPDATATDVTRLPDGLIPPPPPDAGIPDTFVPPPPCTSAADCAGGLVCTSGECRAPSDVCQFDFQCAAGRSCVDGRCLQPCTNTVPNTGCAPSQRCADDGYCRYPDVPFERCPMGCGVGQRCVGDGCLTTCTHDVECSAGQRCVEWTCRVDDRRPPPFCSSDAQCATGSVCRNGVCRAACPTGTDDECQRRDVNFNRCSAERLCVSTGEIAPACALSVDCAAGLQCVDARCR